MTKLSKNSLISLAISKLLIEFDLIQPIEETYDVIKRTYYCDLLKQGKLEIGDTISAIERIYVNSTKQEEIRFAYYKFNKKGNEQLILRPLYLNENELLVLFANAISSRVFTQEFTQKLKALL